jgi:hypothetical protein
LKAIDFSIQIDYIVFGKPDFGRWGFLFANGHSIESSFIALVALSLAQKEKIPRT